MDALTGVVKDHLTTHGKEYINRDYIEKLDDTLAAGIPIDLRSDEEKTQIQNWKLRNLQKTHSEEAHDEKHEK